MSIKKDDTEDFVEYLTNRITKTYREGFVYGFIFGAVTSYLFSIYQFAKQLTNIG